MKALVLTTSKCAASVEEVPTPEPKDNELLVRVRAIALNPVDAMSTAHPLATQARRVLGSDLAGEVIGVSDQLRGSSDPRAQIGARVAGFLQGGEFALARQEINARILNGPDAREKANSGNERPGAFAEFVTPEADLVWLLPPDMSFASAASVSLASTTAAQGVFFRLGLPCPWWRNEHAESKPLTVFIYAASTSVGLYAAQMARLSGVASGKPVRLLGAASKRHHGLLKSAPYHYDGLVDYRDDDWVARARELTPQGTGADVAVDCISEGVTVESVGKVLRVETGRYAVFRAPEGGGYKDLYDRLPIKPIYGAVWEGLGVSVAYRGFTVPANPQAREFASSYYAYLTDGSRQGKAVIQPNPVRVMPGGLEKVAVDGFKVLGGGVLSKSLGQAGTSADEHMQPVSAEKLVYLLS